jgi:WD40 repeat protein
MVGTRFESFHSAPVDEVDFSPDGKKLVTGDRDGKLALWNVATGKVERQLRGHSEGVYTVRFAPNGKWIASAGNEEQVLVWDISRSEGKELLTRLALPGGANRLAFDRSGAMLAVGSDARYVSIWSTGDWRKIFQLDALVGVRSVYGFNPDSGELAFDGENGAVNILPQPAVPIDDLPLSFGTLNGLDVSFDQTPANARPTDVPDIDLHNACPVRR